MRTLILAVTISLVATTAIQAETPPWVNYQGYLTDENGLPLSDGEHSLRFSLWTAYQGGGRVWGYQYFNGTANPRVEVVDGYFNVRLGQDTYGRWIGDAFGDSHELYLSVYLDGVGEILPRQRILSAPHAIAADRLGQPGAPVSSGVESGGGGFLSLRGASGNEAVRLNTKPGGAGGQLVLRSGGGATGVVATVNDLGAGRLRLYGAQGSHAVELNSTNGGTDGFLGLRNENSQNRVKASVNGSDDAGHVITSGPNGDLVVITSNGLGAGKIETRGPNGSNNVRVSTSSHALHGSISVKDAAGNSQAGMHVNDSRQGIVWGDQKSFTVEHPDKPGHRIVYISVEGPEAGIYHRGTVDLKDGRATITLPEHFYVLCRPTSITVQLTPHSVTSRGVAVASIDGDRIEIGELSPGGGSYKVSFLVHAVREALAGHRPVLEEQEFREKFDRPEVGEVAGPVGSDSADAGPADLDAPGTDRVRGNALQNALQEETGP